MTHKEFFEKYPVPYKKKGWPDDLRWHIQSCYNMDDWWTTCCNPKHLVLVLKTLNYCEEIWKYPIMKWGLDCRDFNRRAEASVTCCDRIRNKVKVSWRKEGSA